MLPCKCEFCAKLPSVGVISKEVHSHFKNHSVAVLCQDFLGFVLRRHANYSSTLTRGQSKRTQELTTCHNLAGFDMTLGVLIYKVLVARAYERFDLAYDLQ